MHVPVLRMHVTCAHARANPSANSELHVSYTLSGEGRLVAASVMRFVNDEGMKFDI